MGDVMKVFHPFLGLIGVERRQGKAAGMLAITPTAVQAIQGLISQPEIPDGAGLKLSGQMTPEGAAIELSVVSGPEETDQVLEAEDAKIFVAAPLTQVLDDKILDAGVEEGQVEFRLVEQNRDGSH